MKILILKPSSLGDVIHALPVLRLIKKAHPTAEVDWWIDSGLAPLLEGDPDISRLVLFHRRRWATPRHWPEVWDAIRSLRAQQYDWVIDLQCLARTGVVAWLARGKFLIGLDEPREGARGFYDVIVRRPTPQTHAVDWYLSVLPHLGVPVSRDFDWLPKRETVHAGLVQKWGAADKRWIVFQPGARWATKRWPVEHFAQLARLVHQRLPKHHIAVLGGQDDQSFGETIAAAVPDRCLNLAGQLNLQEMIEWIRLSDLMVSNDTGPMHVGAALNKPVVALFGPTDARRTGPYAQIQEVLKVSLPCAPCFSKTCRNPELLACLWKLHPEQVLAEIERRLPIAS